MTVKELSQLYYLKREIKHDQRRLEALENQIGVGATVLDGMPKSPNWNNSKVERLAVEIVDLRAIIAAKQIQLIHEQQRLERFINAITDSETRLILKLRFVDGLSWTVVAKHLGEGHTADRVKKVCYRYLNGT